MNAVRIQELELLIQKSVILPEAQIRYSLDMSAMGAYIEEQIRNSVAFRELLFYYLDIKGFKTDSEFYNKAGIDRRHFSKIKGNDKQVPRRSTVMASIIALELNDNEAERLMGAVGYTFNLNNPTDIIVKYCIENQIYDRGDVDETLIYFGEKPLLD